MRLGLFLTTLIGLAGASHISSAADATWVAVSTLENGTSPYCAGGQFTGQPCDVWNEAAADAVRRQDQAVANYRPRRYVRRPSNSPRRRWLPDCSHPTS